MRVTVCELDAAAVERSWELLVAHVHAAGSDLVVLPEMAFAEWLPSTRDVRPQRWQQAVTAHDGWLARLPQLGAVTVAGSRPTATASGRFNEAFVWAAGSGYRAVHRKTYLPDEPGFWEASWYDRGPTRFEPVDTPAGRLGFLVCTELWFLEHARAYAAAGVELLVCPRVTPADSVARWLAGGRVAASCAGAFCVSSNRAGEAAGVRFGGTGWVAEPDGDVLAATSADEPCVTVDVDLAVAARAKRTYPRYVDDSPLERS